MNDTEKLMILLGLIGFAFIAMPATASILESDTLPTFNPDINPDIIPESVAVTLPDPDIIFDTTPILSTNITIIPDIVNSTLDQRINAFLAMIRKFESNNDYFILYGGQHFTDCSKHPWEGKPLPRHSAAGAYQFSPAGRAFG